MEGESAKRGGEETLKSWAPLGLLAGLLALLLWLGGQGAAAPVAAAPQASAVPAASGQPERVFVRLSAGTERERAEAQAGEADAEPEMELAVYLAQEDRLSVMGLEDFVRHAVAGEMPASFAPEALKAQAVAARSYALWKSALFGGGGCSQRTGADVCTDSGHCMAYADESSLRQSWGEDYQENWAAAYARLPLLFRNRFLSAQPVPPCTGGCLKGGLPLQPWVSLPFLSVPPGNSNLPAAYLKGAAALIPPLRGGSPP